MKGKEFISGHSVRLVHGGESYFSTLLKLIDECASTLHLQVYIFDLDETGNRVLHALLQAAQRGVSVYLVVDGFGSMSLGKAFKNRMEEIGIYFRFFSPMPFPGIFQAGRRLHHKVCVADCKYALVGGINIADKYRGGSEDLPWLDYALLIEGSVAQEIHEVCESIYNRKFLEKSASNLSSTPRSSSNGVFVRMTRNDWIRRKNEISSAYKRMVGNAQEEVLVVASYFIPSRRMLKILIRASRRGRKVSIILGKNSDVPFAKPATQYLYSKLLRNGIRIYEYSETVLHAKVCVVDKKWVSIGSLNLNHLSELLSLEMNLEVLDRAFGSSLNEELHQLILNQCVEVKTITFNTEQTVIIRLKNWISYKLIALSMRLLSFLSRKNPTD